MIFGMGYGARRGLAFSLLCATLGGCAPVVNHSSPPQPMAATMPVPAPVKPAAPAPVPRPEIKIGLLLPLSGSQAQLGRSLLDAGQMALYEGEAEVALLPFDTGESAEQAKTATRTALAQGAQILIGPVFSNAVAAAQPLAEAANVPLLALSNNATLADSNTFILGLAPAEQVKRMLEYAASHNLARLALLTPDTPYGATIAQAMADHAARLGLTLVQTEKYSAGADSAFTVQNLMASVNARGGAQAVLIPEGGRTLSGFATALAAVTPKPQLLGTALWETADVRLPALQGGIYAALPNTGHSGFVTRFSGAYGYTPAPLASFSYDAVKLALNQAKQGVIGFNPNRLTRPESFSGVDGNFTLQTDGRVVRQLTVYQITPEGPQVLAGN